MLKDKVCGTRAESCHEKSRGLGGCKPAIKKAYDRKVLNWGREALTRQIYLRRPFCYGCFNFAVTMSHQVAPND